MSGRSTWGKLGKIKKNCFYFMLELTIFVNF